MIIEMNKFAKYMYIRNLPIKAIIINKTSLLLDGPAKTKETPGSLDHSLTFQRCENVLLVSLYIGV